MILVWTNYIWWSYINSGPVLFLKNRASPPHAKKICFGYQFISKNSHVYCWSYSFDSELKCKNGEICKSCLSVYKCWTHWIFRKLCFPHQIRSAPVQSLSPFPFSITIPIIIATTKYSVYLYNIFCPLSKLPTRLSEPVPSILSHNQMMQFVIIPKYPIVIWINSSFWELLFFLSYVLIPLHCPESNPMD